MAAKSSFNPIAYITQRSQALGVDPRAALAVAKMEGLGGGIGDGGHAFGPFQLNNAGGVLTGKFKGMNAGQINQWAWSPQGIDYALQGIAKVAKGLTGSQAVNAIVSRFERPAAPAPEIAGALRAYGSAATAGTPQTGGSFAAGKLPGTTGAGGAQAPSPFFASPAAALAQGLQTGMVPFAQQGGQQGGLLPLIQMIMAQQQQRAQQQPIVGFQPF